MTKLTSQTNTIREIPENAAGGVLHIDLDALASNWRILRDNAGGVDTAAVVKANAYGIGIEQAVPALARAGCRTFFVAHLSEAIRARAVAPDAAIYVLNGLLPGTGPTYAEFDLRPVLGSLEEIGEWAAFSPRARPETEGRDPCRYRYEPARPHRAAGPDAQRLQRAEGFRDRASHEPFRERGGERQSAQCSADRSVPGREGIASRHSGVARQFLGHLPQGEAAFRPRPSGLRALWRQSDAGPGQSHARGRRARRPDRTAALGRGGSHGRL